MRSTNYRVPGDVRVETVPDPAIEQATDAVVRVTHACICGSDLWFYRGTDAWQPGWRTGHEWMGVVEDVGSEVRTMKKGDYVIAPFMFSDGSCEFCHQGLHSSCSNGGVWGTTNDGGQGEAVRAPLADGTLVVIPREVAGDDRMMTALLPLTDVMGTGHHAAVSAGVRAGSSVAVVGDGAVGLCGVLAARRLGAERIIVLGRHEARLDVARGFGATDVVTARGDEAKDQVRELTGGGVQCVMECVGSVESMGMALDMVRRGGSIGYVGVPHGVTVDVGRRLFRHNIGLRGGLTPVRAYLPELMADVLAGRIDPTPVLDQTVDLDGVPAGYAAMDDRQAIKVRVRL